MLLSRTTGLLLRREDQGVRLIDAKTREPLLRIEEQDRALSEMKQALRAAQEEIERLRGKRDVEASKSMTREMAEGYEAEARDSSLDSEWAEVEPEGL
jgi:hypothetical protein